MYDESGTTEMTETARVLAERLAADLRTRTRGDMRPRVWTGNGVARVYTGYGSEYVQVEANGRTERSKSRMTWGHVIDEATEALTN